MNVTLKLYAVLGEYLPANAEKNEATVEVAAGITVQGLLDAHGVPGERCHLVLVNGHYVAPSERSEKSLVDGDALAVWPPVAGG